MKFAIFGDIHANLEAFDAVMEDAKALGADQFVCIGDVVGYNANPHECVSRLQELGCPVVKGNHDEEASATTEIVGLNPLAHAALEWTRHQLTTEDKLWLRNLRMVRQVRDFTIVHATLDTPTGWAYVMNRFDAMASYVLNKNVSFQLNVQNLGDKVYFDRVSSPHYAGVGAGRSATLTANLKF